MGRVRGGEAIKPLTDQTLGTTGSTGSSMSALLWPTVMIIVIGSGPANRVQKVRLKIQLFVEWSLLMTKYGY